MKYLTLALLSFAFLQAEEAPASSDKKPPLQAEENWVAVADEDDDIDAELAQDDSADQENCDCSKKKKG